MPKNLPQEDNALPNQEKFFSQSRLRKSARAGSQLPDPKIEPYGYDPKSRFNHLFPDIHLPILLPPKSHHPEDTLSFGYPELPSHELYLGDNLSVLRNIPSESIDLIYIDPPFFSNRTYTQIWGDDNEIRSFGDIFEDGMPSYLAWLNARLWEMKRVLKNTGSIYVHCDWHASHYIKCEMDKIFGYDNFRNEIVWHYGAGNPPKNDFARKHDIILRYSKTDTYVFNTNSKCMRVPFNNTAIKMHFNNVDEDGRYYRKYASGNISYADEGKVATTVWTDIDGQEARSPISKESIGYPTQKPERILERILSASSNPGDVVADFFVGGGTTGAAAMKLGRRFIGSDISRVAVSVTADRLARVGEEISTGAKKTEENALQLTTGEAVADIRVGYVGSYPIEKFSGMEHSEFVRFVVDIYGGVSYTGESQYIHGLANNKLVLYVGPSDPNTMVSLDDVKKSLEDTLRAYQRQLSDGEEKILQVIGWKFDPSLTLWKRQTVDFLNKKGLKISIELVSLGSEAFRERIFRVIGEANIDLKFNRLNAMLNFAGTPYAGVITLQSNTQIVRDKKGITVHFELSGARPVGTARLINAQWDFDLSDSRFADRDHALNRAGTNGDFSAILTVEHTFEKLGTYLIAAKVQDSLDGEAMTSSQLILTENEEGLVVANLERIK
ncbi:site-specific DNA-methyltransferase [Candidatus Gracilibacteria bacterium]|nr:site-specific DNA-methyltransferase [Candidatus Gracilibacteria bacterium]